MKMKDPRNIFSGLSFYIISFVIIQNAFLNKPGSRSITRLRSFNHSSIYRNAWIN